MYDSTLFVMKKDATFYFYDNYCKCLPILMVILLLHPEMNYLVKFEYSDLQLRSAFHSF